DALPLFRFRGVIKFAQRIDISFRGRAECSNGNAEPLRIFSGFLVLGTVANKSRIGAFGTIIDIVYRLLEQAFDVEEQFEPRARRRVAELFGVFLSVPSARIHI